MVERAIGYVSRIFEPQSNPRRNPAIGRETGVNWRRKSCRKDAPQKYGPAIYLLLVSADGKPVNKQVLDMVAEPLEITGEVERQGELLILRADPVTYRKL